MPVLLYRVDERLIHGQVVVGWGAQLRPDQIVVVDDELAESPWEQELYTLGLPPDVGADFYDVASARSRLPGWKGDPRRIILLIRDIGTLVRLGEGGLLQGEHVNIGGIHYAPGRREVLPYVYLSPAEERELGALAESGVAISARDLPGSRRFELSDLLRRDRRDR